MRPIWEFQHTLQRRPIWYQFETFSKSYILTFLERVEKKMLSKNMRKVEKCWPLSGHFGKRFVSKCRENVDSSAGILKKTFFVKRKLTIGGHFEKKIEKWENVDLSAAILKKEIENSGHFEINMCWPSAAISERSFEKKFKEMFTIVGHFKKIEKSVKNIDN